MDTILENDILKSAGEVEKGNQKLGKGGFSEENIIIPVRDGMSLQKFPKYRHCLDGGREGADHCLDFCEGFVHMH